MYAYFHIDYSCHWGEQIYLTVGTKPVVGDALPADALALGNDGRGNWFGQMDAARLVSTAYHYVLATGGRIVRTEWGEGHFLPSEAMMAPREADAAVQHGRTLHLYDGWAENPADRPFFTTAFTESIFAHPHPQGSSPDAEPCYHCGQAGTLTLICEAATVRKGMVLAVCGNQPELGDWDPVHAAVMDASAQPLWRLTLDRTELRFPLLYKFVLLDAATRELVAWEDCPNRYFDPGTLRAGDSIILRSLRLASPLHPWRGAGTAIPVFSLRSRSGCGIGEFADLPMLVDWAERTGQQVIQILPVNDTTMTHTWRDSYPYNCNSTFALNPIYIRLEDVGTLADAEAMRDYRRRRAQLQRLPAVDYEKVSALKWDYLRRIHAQQGEADMATEAYRDFHSRNAHWLEPYALFCTLRDRYGTPDFGTWREAEYSPALLERLRAKDKDGALDRELSLHRFIQFHLHLQLLAARDYAHRHGVILKGDIPIGISRHSVDAWADARLFHLDSQAGAPPDAFDKNGQNWGFPTYNWEEMRRDGYEWFRERFIKMSDYFDAYRIDHILGFFRIWEVPMDTVQGLLGHFNPARPLSPAEMLAAYGFAFDRQRHAVPYVTDAVLADVFEGDAEYIERQVRQKFLEPAAGASSGVPAATYRLAPRFATQRGVEGYFAKKPKAEQAHRRQMFRLLTEVLFVEDPYCRGAYHPRIDGMDTHSFRALAADQQEAYRRLHEDFFYHSHDAFWRDEAMRKLPVLVDATRMLCCGEDLGMIPACVGDVMAELRILSLEVQRMPKSFRRFGDPQTYPYYSVCTTSSHDLSNLRAWWREPETDRQAYYNEQLGCAGVAPEEAEPWICRKIIEQHLASPAMLCILPLQDWLSVSAELRHPRPEEERINVPSDPDNYWHYRMHLDLEALVEADDLNGQIAGMIRRYDR